MGQKVNPHGLRVGVIKDWDSKWYAEADFADFLVEDYNIRTYLKKKLYAAGVSKIEIERDNAKVKINIHCSRPGVIIGKGGTEIEAMRQKDLGLLCSRMGNVLETVTIPNYPVIAEIKEHMMEHGAVHAMMSGSGPTVFGLFANGDTAVAAYEAMRESNLAKRSQKSDCRTCPKTSCHHLHNVKTRNSI